MKSSQTWTLNVMCSVPLQIYGLNDQREMRDGQETIDGEQAKECFLRIERLGRVNDQRVAQQESMKKIGRV